MKRVIVYILVGCFIITSVLLFGLRINNMNRDLVEVVDDYHKYNGEVAKYDIGESEVLLYYYNEKLEISFSVLKERAFNYEYITGGGTYNMYEYLVDEDETYESDIKSMVTSILTTDNKYIVCGKIDNPLQVSKVMVNGKLASFVDIEENFNVNIRFDLSNVRVFYAVFDDLNDYQVNIIAYDEEGDIIEEKDIP